MDFHIKNILSHMLQEINLSGNELSPRAIEILLDRVSQGLHLKSLVLHTNNMGVQFDKVKSKCAKYNFIDLGEERLIF